MTHSKEKTPGAKNPTAKETEAAADPALEEQTEARAEQPSAATQKRSETSSGAASSRAGRKRKRRTKGAASRSVSRSKWQDLDEDGRERPRFLASFPDDPELDVLARAFEKGNYAYVRTQAPKLAKKSSNPDVQRAALELRERIKADPLVKYILAISVLLLVYLVIDAYGH